MSMTPAQRATLLAAFQADSDQAVIDALAIGNATALVALYNAPSAFIVRKSNVQTDEIGKAVSYVAVGSLTTANTSRVQVFYDMNPNGFAPTADVEQFFNDTFSGALGGAGQATRDALTALWRRPATKAEAVFATGVGTTASPGTLVWEGLLDINTVGQALSGV